ncbi:MAG: hypothetical protein AAB845_02050 [Patescibacteria group bacterium]
MAVSPVLAQEAPTEPTPVPVADETVTPPPATESEPAAPAETVIIQYTLTYAAGIGGTLTGTTSQTVDDGGSGTSVTPVPDAGYVFVDWSDSSTANPRTDTAVTTNLSVTANFVEEPTPVIEPVIEEVDVSADLVHYTNYRLYQKYEKREQYRKYLRYRQLAGKYPWENRKAEKKALKSLKKDYKKYQKSPSRYSHLRARASDYTNYGSLKAEYLSVKAFAGYTNNILFDKESYSNYKDYGTEENRLGFERYKKAIEEGKVVAPEEDENEDLSVLGPEITVGIFNYVPNDLKNTSMSLKANVPFRVLDRDGKVQATIAADTKIRVKYLGDKQFLVYYSGTDVQIAIVSREVRFSASEEYKDSVVFDVSRPNSSFDHYRGSIRLRHYDSPVTDGDRIWVINKLPLEHYVWGMGEITGTGAEEYNRVMTTIFRTYGFWKIQWSTKYAAQGFKVDATSGSQIYYGYDWEITHDRIRTAAEVSRGILVFYDNEVALTPYSSWTDGKTRRYEDGHWGHNCAEYRKKTSSTYPWLSSVEDSYGKNPDLGTCELASRGNHMVGLSANGAVKMARDGGYDYQSILRHFYTGITLAKNY